MLVLSFSLVDCALDLIQNTNSHKLTQIKQNIAASDPKPSSKTIMGNERSLTKRQIPGNEQEHSGKHIVTKRQKRLLYASKSPKISSAESARISLSSWFFPISLKRKNRNPVLGTGAMLNFTITMLPFN